MAKRASIHINSPTYPHQGDAHALKAHTPKQTVPTFTPNGIYAANPALCVTLNSQL